MFCSISGAVPEQPVVSKKTGHIYEKRLILKHLDLSGGKCPETGQDLSADDLIDIVSSSSSHVHSHSPSPLASTNGHHPLPALGATLPALLTRFQKEWDALVLQLHDMKIKLHQTRQDLAMALYQNDAAKRVIARLIKERDQARILLNTTTPAAQAQASTETAPQPMAVDNVQDHIKDQDRDQDKAANESPSAQKNVFADDVWEKIESTAQQLLQQRKQRKVPETLAPSSDISKYSMKSQFTSPAKSITCSALNPHDQNILAIANSSGLVCLVDIQSKSKITQSKAHKAKVHSIQYNPVASHDFAFASTDADGVIKLWSNASEKKISTSLSMEHHSAAVVDSSWHPTGSYLAAASKDGSWSFSDTREAKPIWQQEPTADSYYALKCHPDGLILGTGDSACKVKIWDLKSMNNVATFEDPQIGSGAISSLCFSENGYYLASSMIAQDGLAYTHLWDLRKLVSIRKLELGQHDPSHPVSLCFDYSGTYLSVATENEIILLESKKFKEIVRLQSGQSTGPAFWGTDAKSILITSDSKILLYGPTDS